MTTRDVESVLFVCGRNVVRSPIARALTESVFPGRFRMASAGIAPGERDPFVDVVLAEIGLSLDDHCPTALDALGDLSFDLVITLAPEACAALVCGQRNSVRRRVVAPIKRRAACQQGVCPRRAAVIGERGDERVAGQDVVALIRARA